MKHSTHFISIALPLFAAVLLAMSQTSVADSETVFNDVCADCHFIEDFEGAEQADLLAFMLSVKAGEQKHAPLEFTDDEAALMAEYLTQE